MIRIHMIRLLTISLLHFACSGERECLLGSFPDVDPGCRDAMHFAASYTAGIRPTDAEVVASRDFIDLARTADTRFDRIHSRGMVEPAVVVRTSRESVAQAWTAGLVLTGEEDVDSILAEAGAIRVEPRDDGRFLLAFSAPINGTNFEAALPSLPPNYSDFGVYSVECDALGVVGNGFITRVEREPAQVRFTVLWGSVDACTAQYEHYWIVQTLAEENFAVVVEESGSPLPPEWAD